eukprot:jgi/Tetstr1/443331/TSEL_031346.t1
MCTGVKNASVDGPCHTPTSRRLKSTLKGTTTGIPYALKKMPAFPIAAPPHIERICYATFNYRAGYNRAAEDHIYAKETVIAAI